MERQVNLTIVLNDQPEAILDVYEVWLWWLTKSEQNWVSKYGPKVDDLRSQRVNYFMDKLFKTVF